MAQTKSGILHLTKTEIKNLEVLIRHVKADISYGWGGSYGGYDEENKKEEEKARQEVKKAKDALQTLEFILQITKS